MRLPQTTILPPTSAKDVSFRDASRKGRQGCTTPYLRQCCASNLSCIAADPDIHAPSPLHFARAQLYHHTIPSPTNPRLARVVLGVIRRRRVRMATYTAGRVCSGAVIDLCPCLFLFLRVFWRVMNMGMTEGGGGGGREVMKWNGMAFCSLAYC